MARGALDMVPRVVPPNIAPSTLLVTLGEDTYRPLNALRNDSHTDELRLCFDPDDYGM